MSYKLKIGGTTYTAESREDGTVTYDPPLPESVVSKSEDNLREILESRQCPGLRTDTDFHAGRGSILQQFDNDEAWTKHVVQQSKKRGYTPGVNDVYIGQIADGTGDPLAWFKPGEGRSELKRRAVAKGMGIEAPGISVKPREYVEKEPVKLAPDLVKQMSRQYRKTGEAAGMSDAALASMVIKRHGKQD